MVDRNAAVAGIAGFFLANFAVAAAWCWRRAPKTKSGHRNFDENHTPDIVSGCRQVKYANEVVLSLGSAVGRHFWSKPWTDNGGHFVPAADDGPLSPQPLDNLIFTK